MQNLYLPALKGRIGDWNYYTAIMKFKDIAERIKLVEEIHKSDQLKDLIQRSLTPRASQIADYLIEQQQRFFNSIIVGVYGGDPEWLEIAVNLDTNKIEIPEISITDNGILGFLKLSGDEKLFPLDGQHRVAGIKKALKNKEMKNKLEYDEVSIIFVGHQRTEKGLERTRRLFTTLNRHAKPVKLAEIIALDEDDISAIVTRELIENHELFKNQHISLSKGNSIPISDNRSFTNIVSLYKANDLIIPQFLNIRSRNKWNEYKKLRPKSKDIESISNYIVKFWNLFINKFSVLTEFINSKEINKADKFRNSSGGHILFRPVGLLIYCNVISTLLRYDRDLKNIFNLLSKIETDMTKEPWKGILWETLDFDTRLQKIAVSH